MKKTIFILLISITIFGIFSCDLGDAITGPRDTWCERNIEVKGVELICYLLFSENGYTHSGLNQQRFENGLEPGLTVILAPTEAPLGKPYVAKTFALGANSVSSGNGDTDPEEFNVGSTLWNAIWLCNMTTFNNNGPQVNPPSLLNSGGNFNPFDDTDWDFDFTWKDIVIAILEGI